MPLMECVLMPVGTGRPYHNPCGLDYKSREGAVVQSEVPPEHDRHDSLPDSHLIVECA